jgi:hypothetical protein
MLAILINFAVENEKQTTTMKLKNILMLLALALGTFTFVACGDDEPEQEPISKVSTEQAAVNKEVVGTYTGWTKVVSGIYPNGKNYPDGTLTLSIAENGTLTLTFVNKSWGTTIINNVNAQKGDNGYSIQGGEGKLSLTDPRNNTSQDFACKLDECQISTDKTQATVAISFTMTGTPHAETVITFQTGEMPTEE